jgi:hypothetical protein
LEFRRSNRVAKYCDQIGIYNESGFATPEAFVLPLISNHVDNLGYNIITQQREEYDVRTVLSSKIGMEMNILLSFIFVVFNSTKKELLKAHFQIISSKKDFTSNNSNIVIS